MEVDRVICGQGLVATGVIYHGDLCCSLDEFVSLIVF